MSRSVLVFSLLAAMVAACGTPIEAEELASTAAAVRDGTPEGVGVLALIGDPATDVALLDVPVGLDRRAAENIVARRNGADGVVGTADDKPFRTIGALDAVPYVGPAAFQKLIAYAAANGFVPAGSDLLGVYDNVAFSVDEAEATLELVNSAEHAYLDDTLRLDRRAADSIVAAQPIATVLELSELGYVGESALNKLKQAAGGSADGGQAVVSALEAAVEGLYHMSESDYPFDVVTVSGGGDSPITADNIKDRIASIYVEHDETTPLAAREVEVRSLEEFFARYTEIGDYWEPEQLEAAPKFQAVYEILRDRLLDAQVYRLGYRYRSGSYTSPHLSGAIDVFIVGRSHDGHLVGLYTISVET